MPDRREVSYTDELLADGTVARRYSDGRQEWRTRGENGVVFWRDSIGNNGVDEPLGRRIVKRTHANGTVLYGREAGFGRTLWGDGVLTVNRSRFGGRLGAILAGVAGTALVGSLVLPPLFMSPEEEMALRAEPVHDTTGGGLGDGAGYTDWGGDDDTGDDFG